MVELRWMFLNSEVMGFAYLLNSKTRGLENMITKDKPDTKKQLRDYIDMYFNEEARFAQQSKTELVEYLTRIDSEDIDNIIVDSELECFQWWAIYEKSNYPPLCKVSLWVYQVPTSSAESERDCSVFNNVHTEKQNRLYNSTVENPVFVYINRYSHTDTKNLIFEPKFILNTFFVRESRKIAKPDILVTI